MGRGPGYGTPARNEFALRRQGDERPAAAYTWRVAPGGVLVVVDLDRDGWGSANNDADGIVAELAELRLDLAHSVPHIVYRDSTGRWHAMRISSPGIFGGFVQIGVTSKSNAVAWGLAQRK